MRKVIANEWVPLDGVAQAPGDPDEDRSGGFEHGGWHLRFFDEASQEWQVDNLTHAGGSFSGGVPTRCSPNTGRMPRRRSRLSPNR
jgi:hypothetical protein